MNMETMAPVPEMHDRWTGLSGPALFCLIIVLGGGTGCGHGPQPTEHVPGGTAASSTSVVDFLDGLPRCKAGSVASSPHAVREEAVGTKVSAQGVMVHNPKWECADKRCGQPATTAGAASGQSTCCGACATPWMIVDTKEAARPYMSRARLYLRQRGSTDLLSLTARDCDVAGLNALPPRTVIVSGIFSGPARRGGGSYLIEDAALCALQQL